MMPYRNIISVIINNYNYGKYLDQSIQSVLSQTRPADEFIIVDDGSTDNSREILDRFTDNAIIVLRENGGQAAAFNSGFALASGNIIFFLDSDDMLKPDCLASVDAVWRDGVSKVHFYLDVINENGETNGLVRPLGKLPSGNLVEDILSQGAYHSSPTSGNAFNRRALEQIFPLPEQQWRSHADCPLLFLSPFFGEVVCIDKTLGFYRMHGDNMTGLFRDRQLFLPKLLSEIARDVRQDELLATFCRQHGFSYQPGTLLKTWHSVKSRLVAKCLHSDRASMTSLVETRLHLILLSIQALIISREQSPFRKLGLIAWSIALSAAPKTVAKGLANIGYRRQAT